MAIEALEGAPRPACEWIESGLREIAGQDPLGLQTITTDRILPGLLPGVLALARRARYFSIYPFIVRAYGKTGGARADNQGLDVFMRQREFEICIASNLCTRCNADSAVGNLRVRNLVAGRPSDYPRGLSIKTELGGYGLYYRSPLEELEVIAAAGRALIGDVPTSVDLLRPETRATQLAEAFEEAVADTRWYRHWMRGVDPIPADVMEELSQVACLCRLDEHPNERQKIRDALLSHESPDRAEPAEQRRRAFALLLDRARDVPAVLHSDRAFRAAVIDEFLRVPNAPSPRTTALAQWAAAFMRECIQDCLSTLWLLFCRAGLENQPFDGFTREQLREMVDRVLIGSGNASLGGNTISAAPGAAGAAWLDAVRRASGGLGWEELREHAARTPTALEALAVLVELSARALEHLDDGISWVEVARVDGANQPGLLRTAETIRRLLDRQPTVSELLQQVLDGFIVRVHETVAMSKLPESTFRFYWEHGRLRFVDNGVWRFDPSGMRRDALATIARDLDWWSQDGDEPAITADGQAVVQAVFGK
jgi:hypothetical protein